MIRLALLYSPAAVTALMALTVALYGRTDGIVIGWLLVLTVAVVCHTYQVIEDRHNGRHR